MDAATQSDTLTLPDELNGPTPRRAMLSDNARRGAIALPIGFVIALAITIAIARTQIPQIRTRLALEIYS